MPRNALGDDLISAPCQRLIRRDRTLEIFDFHARDQTNFFQRRELLLRFARVPKHQIKFSEVLVGAAVAPIEQYGFLIMLLFNSKPQLEAGRPPKAGPSSASNTPGAIAVGKRILRRLKHGFVEPFPTRRPLERSCKHVSQRAR